IWTTSTIFPKTLSQYTVTVIGSDCQIMVPAGVSKGIAHCTTGTGGLIPTPVPASTQSKANVFGLIKINKNKK
ncbi:hypothetical protein, partial [Providencia rettgeri]|uniref:hypothetical protein n=1 Tax=Providencia rettgeri TaxID=587 RepID=UPI001C8351EA